MIIDGSYMDRRHTEGGIVWGKWGASGGNDQFFDNIYRVLARGRVLAKNPLFPSRALRGNRAQGISRQVVAHA